MVLVGVPLVIVPILALGRKLRALSRESQDRIAEGSALASETLLAAQTVQAYTHEGASRDALRRAGGGGVRRRAQADRHTRGDDGYRDLPRLRLGRWACSGWARATCGRGAMTPGELVHFVIYAVMVAGSAAALSEIWSELLRGPRATERMIELLEAPDTVHDPTRPAALPARVEGAIRFEGVTFRYPARPRRLR
jgi:ATP-binding cassette subfamily B protein